MSEEMREQLKEAQRRLRTATPRADTPTQERRKEGKQK